MLTYTVQQGDTLWEIAKEHQISLDSLLMANPQISDPNIIMPGMMLNIPQLSPYSRNPNISNISNMSAEPKTTLGSTQKKQTAGTQTAKKRPYIYFAKQGENLQNIAKANQLSVLELAKVNQHLPANKALKNNDKVFIPSLSPAAVQTNAASAEKTKNIMICPRCGYKIFIR